MWLKYLIIILLFYFFAILQNSFFAHFNFMGAVPNLVFILFFTLIFFTQKRGFVEVIFYSFAGGFFLYIFSDVNFSASVILLLIIGLSEKNAQKLLRNKQNDDYPFIYFLPLFFVSILAYDLLSSFIINSLNFSWPVFNLTWGFVSGIIYNLIIASIIFLAYKNFFSPAIDNRQLPLLR